MSKDYSYLEADAGGEVDHQGWPKKPPISDRECIYKCLENGRLTQVFFIDEVM